MNDDIQLPPLTGEYYSFSKGEVHEYGRACYEAGLAAARAEQAQPAKLVVHEARIILKSNGSSWFTVDAGYIPTKYEIGVTLRWTDDGRAWIDSEKNRDMARRLRVVAEFGYTAPTDAALRDAADVLDGGDRG